MKEAAHLVRLAVAFLIAFLAFLIVRQAVVPKNFGQYGHFRPGALDDVRTKPIKFAGRTACEMCHEEQLKVIKLGKHANVGCESCHGAQARHAMAEDPSAAKPVLPDTKKLCAQCHEANFAKPHGFPQVKSAEHSGGQACNSCHKPHSPKM